MKRFWLLTVVALALAVTTVVDSVSAFERVGVRRRARTRAPAAPWHGGYYLSGWGMPVALVVPPTAEFQTHWGWGVANTRITPIRSQFQRNYPGPGYYERGMIRPTPPWPSDTDQFGVYYVRGPW